ncbi:MAG: hypothetical protein Q8M08_01405 [Bacteroidales bacterium]|nr:hypothetical protein [Bacteroidales bacterium]
MKRNITILFAVLIPVLGFTQEKDTKFSVNFSGFIKNDFFWDSRQTVSIREGHFLLYPMKIDRDANGKDLNAKSNFNFLSIQTRLTMNVTGPDVFKAKVSGVVEADFFGNENAAFVDVNGFRLRHGFVKLNWPKTELLFGQYWHPMFNPECFPGVVSFNTGAPFQAFARNPQMRLTQKLGDFKLMFAACSQRDFVSPGGSSVSLRNSSIPDLDLQFSYGFKNDSTKKEFLIGLGGGYKIVAPRIYSDVTTTTVVSPSYVVYDTLNNPHVIPAVTKTTTAKYKVDEQLGGFYSIFFMKYKCKTITYKLYAAYGQNIFDITMLGGYAVSKINDPAIWQKDYTPFNTFSAWTELNTNGKKIQAGLFAGYTQNMGTSADILDYSTTNRGADIKCAYRVSPRVIFISGKFQIMTELELTSAYYADKDATGMYYRDIKGVITQSSAASNLRILCAIQYHF